MATYATEFFGETLVKKEIGEVKSEDALANKAVVGIYFSAHWCPPCRGFTPRLSEFYAQAVDNAPEDLEIVFVSSDRDEGAAESYFAEMGDWLMLPFANREKKQELAEKYGVRGIPTFVVINGATGELISKTARGDVGADIEGAINGWKASL